jgi:hypothetical protein
VDPAGKQFIVLSERFLNAAVSANDIVHRVEGALAAKMHAVGTPQFQGSDTRAAAYAVFAGRNGSTMLNLDLVLPNPERYGLLLSLGFDTTNSNIGLQILAKIEASLVVSDEAGVRASRTWLHYNNSGLSLDYPLGWAANFTSTSGVWFAGPSDQAIVYAIGRTYSGSASADLATSLGRQIESLVQSKIHPDLKVVNETSSAGVYRWLATYSDGNAKSVGVEYGQAVFANGNAQAMWGDTDLEQLPANLPIFDRVLDSAARGAGLPAPDALDLAGAVHAIAGDAPAGTAQGQSTTNSASPQQSSSAYVAAYSHMMQQHADYTFMSNMMMEDYAANMNMISDIGGGDYSYEVVDSTDGY